MPRPLFRRNTSGRGRGGGRGRGHRRGNASNPNRERSHKQNTKQFPEVSLENVCCECKESCPSYKCPQCLQKYCSVTCYKVHKAGTNCIEMSFEEGESRSESFKISQNKREPGGRVEYLYPTGDTIRPEGLEKLTQEPLKSKIVPLLRSKRLRDKIRSLDSSRDPRGLMNSFVDDKEFSEFRTFIIENLSNDLFR